MAFALAGCGSGVQSGGKACTAIGGLTGIGLDVAPSLAAGVERASLRVCWDGACHTPELRLDPATSAAPQTCTGTGPDDTCGASVVRTGGLTGFAMVPDLPKRPVQVTLKLHGSGPEPALDRSLTVTPRGSFPNGPDCGEQGVQARLTAEDGRLRAHP
ncbi:hypothetical protein DPM19_19135 [Actinomadura craniellae]|uniref:Uncharacterized protein n=2 Tax=Actinomadura craniellae TaxID=2231787 RepID=A0A365H473_9ACTN|nr:hypothetical protein DPM19_19135 [Actinomadura craniellae]